MPKEIYLNAIHADKPVITDENGKHYSVEEAKRLWFDEDLDCNLAFARLVEYNFDFQAVQDYYNG